MDIAEEQTEESAEIPIFDEEKKKLEILDSGVSRQQKRAQLRALPKLKARMASATPDPVYKSPHKKGTTFKGPAKKKMIKQGGA